MASTSAPLLFTTMLPLLLLLTTLLPNCAPARTLSALVEKQPLVLKYHKGRLLSGPIAVNLIWYGNFTSVQRSVISDFVTSLSKPASNSPSVSAWWRTVQKYNSKSPPTPTLGSHTLLPNYPLGKRLSPSQLQTLKSKPDSPKNTINVVLTSSDVAVEGFCTSRCGTHGETTTAPYVWVGDSSLQCPGRCAWPFHKPIYGPQTPPLVSPNADVGVDGMVINLAGLLAGTVTNPYGDGFYHGEKGGGLEVASACAGVYGKGAYPGYAGEVMVEAASGGSFNAYGVGGRKYLLPALVDPTTSDCATLV